MSTFPAALPAARTPDPMAAPAAALGRDRSGLDRRAVHRIGLQRAHPPAGAGRRVPRPRPVRRRSPRITASTGAYGSYQSCSPTRTSTSSTSRPRTTRTTRARCCRLQAGKHTLVEKPIALNATQAAELAALAAARRRVLHRGAVDDVPAEVRRDPAAAGRPARSARSGPSSPTTASTSPPTTGSCGTTWPAGRCWTWAPTRSPSPPGFSASPTDGGRARPAAPGRGERAGLRGALGRRRQPGACSTPRCSAPRRRPAVIAGTAGHADHSRPVLPARPA